MKMSGHSMNTAHKKKPSGAMYKKGIHGSSRPHPAHGLKPAAHDAHGAAKRQHQGPVAPKKKVHADRKGPARTKHAHAM